MPLVDLHAHTKFSDGTTTPAEVVYAYLRAGVQMMSVTDHDTTDAVAQSAEKAAAAGILFVPGVEISTREHDYLHILGYNIDISNPKLGAFLEQNRENRNIRVRKIINKLQAAGLDIGEEDVFSLVKTVASRAHVADALKRKGIAATRQEGFRKYLVEGRPGYEPSQGHTAAEVIAQIKNAGGRAFIAHPGVIKEVWNFPAWVTAGLDGLEVYYPTHSFAMRQDLLEIAAKYNLLASAGSDHHGEKSGRCNKPGMAVPQEVFESLKKALINGGICK